MQFSKNAKWNLRVTGYDTVSHQNTDPLYPKFTSNNLAFVFFVATFIYTGNNCKIGCHNLEGELEPVIVEYKR